MKKIKKRYLSIALLFFLLFVVIAGVIIYFPHLFNRYTIPKTVNVFGSPREQTYQKFPSENPQFTVIIGKIKPATVHQQSITIYKIGSKQKVFERSFYADGFRGSDLTYMLSTNSAEITQTGTIGSLGCSEVHCSLLWSNYYDWDPAQQTFVQNNIGHKNEYEYLLAAYQALDDKGCNIVTGDIIADQANLSFKQLYKKFPTAKYYCSNEQGILPSNLMFFLQAEKVLTEIVNGENVGSSDIRNIPL